MDFGLLFLLTEIFHVYYMISVVIGAVAGAAVNFFLNRHWSFDASHRGVHGQAFRYTLVSAGSLALNSAGIWAVTESLHVHYGISVAVVTFIVGIVFNFPLQRYFVYR